MSGWQFIPDSPWEVGDLVTMTSPDGRELVKRVHAVHVVDDWETQYELLDLRLST
jgi:hypothetical protein